MKDILYVIASITVFTTQLIAQTGWYSQTPKPTGDNLSSVFYLENTIWTVGGSGNVLKSTDDGLTWESKLIGVNYILTGIQFFDQFSGVVFGKEIDYVSFGEINVFGIILFTTDGGNSWSLKYRNSTKPYDVYFINQNTGWAVADSGKVLKTTDGGNNWTEYYCGEAVWLHEISFTDSLNGWMISYLSNGGVFKSSDGGITWLKVGPMYVSNFTSMSFLDGNIGWITGSEILKTTDGGQNWIQLINFGYGSLQDIQFIDPDNGWCISYHISLGTDEILKSNDGGVTWSSQYSNNDIHPKTFHFVDNNVGVTAGQYGAVLTTSNGGNNWNLKTEWIPIALQKVNFPNVNTGFTIGRKGAGISTTFTYFTLKSTDGGTNWNICDSVPSSWLRDLFFINDSKGWIAGYSYADTTGILKYTEDGGNTWSIQYVDPNSAFSSVYFVNESDGWLGGGLGNVLRTSDGGLNWELESFGYDVYTLELFFINSNIGWSIAQGSGHQIIKTTDGGNTWVDITPPNLLDILYDIDFVNEQVGWVVGGHGIVLKTTDGGSTWKQNWPDPWPNGPIFISVDFVSEHVGWIMTDNINIPPYSVPTSNIFFTSDGGNNWSLQAYLNGRTGSIFFLDQQTGWFVSGSYGDSKVGYVYKTTNGGVSFAEENEIEEIPAAYHLQQNYPNPFNPSTMISWLLPVGSWQTLKIYDLLGNEVAILVDEYKPSGIYEVEWNATGLPSGIYFYQLRTDGYVETKKMILMK